MRRQKERIKLTPQDKEFMAKLYENHARIAYYAALREAKDAQLARDLTQDCFECLMKNISTVRSLECCKINAYIVTVIRRLYINYAIKESKKTLLPIDQPSVAAEVESLLAEKDQEQAEIRLTLQTLLEQLSPRDRRILESYYIEGLPDAELAETFCCNADSIRSMRSRVCRKARRIGLRSEEGDETQHG